MKRILVVRNDKIGDFMLAWPAFALLKASLDCHITALVPGYTRPLAELCPSIDAVLADPGKSADAAAQQNLLERLKVSNFDAVICLFSNFRNARLMWQAGIPQRWAPATKLAQVLYNHRVKQRRSESAKPEYEYNLDLVRAFLVKNDITPVEPATPYLGFDASELAMFREQQAAALGIDAGRPWLLVHAGSGGSANNLNTAQYAGLLDRLQAAFPGVQPVLTAGPGEEDLATEVADMAGGGAVVASGLPLPDFCRLLACGQLFVAGSTGPLHIAGALDVPTVGFFPLRRSATPLRWRPLNSEGRHLAFHPPKGAEAEDMSSVDVKAVTGQIRSWASKFLSGASRFTQPSAPGRDKCDRTAP
ncbi:glycosyltransferase family 9 protein [Oceanimonas sp. MB9]|uniref:glycosyltransferase family 9 protein n=1 Tax=Oceanimonas sp. MB9 TaxID=2588453 RepID=UPI0013F59F95|nr:glycosyltransferase family 9 protein [Oceanimonas sp. MB9]NHH99078.1 Lipopolysaccharide core heptosyltransferase RfaQ [Oceanimonas sp. MB9]